jgi:hypothetical protein
MIAGPRRLFEARCRERGYTLEEVRACIVAEDGDQITVDETHVAYPRQAKPGVPPPQAGGPGTELKKLLAIIGITATPDCSCNARARTMDDRGCGWCEEHIDEIVGWLREEATRRKLPFVDAAGRLLVRRAIRNARKVESASPEN